MTITIPLTHDGKVFRPEKPVSLPTDTRVTATLELPVIKRREPYCSIDVVHTLNLEGSSDWSERLDEYLYGGFVSDE